MDRPRWTADELEVLARWYPYGGYEAVVSHGVSKTRQAVYHEASRLHLPNQSQANVDLRQRERIALLLDAASQHLGMDVGELATTIAWMHGHGMLDERGSDEWVPGLWEAVRAIQPQPDLLL